MFGCSTSSKKTTPDEVTSVDLGVRGHEPEIKTCYLRSGEHGGGRFTLLFAILPDGTVDDVRPIHSSFSKPDVEGCVANVLKHAIFEKPVDGRKVEVSYPFEFKAAT